MIHFETVVDSRNLFISLHHGSGQKLASELAVEMDDGLTVNDVIYKEVQVRD